MGLWKNKLTAFFGGGTELTSEFFEELSDLLVEGDFGAVLALKTVDELEARCKKEKIKTAGGAKELLAAMLAEYLACAPSHGIGLEADVLNVFLVLGVNGVGKTTTTAKLAARFSVQAKPLLAAADTFRAAAIEQLKIHGERLGVRTVAHKQNADAAAVVHDALEAAISGGYNPVLADTAGRMHTKSALIEELAKISRVIDRRAVEICGKMSYKKLLVLDATTGTNALVQAETFNSAVQLDGIILTKFDSSARGGVVFPLAVNFRLPITAVCDGERYEDLHDFDTAAYIRQFLM
ncbi:MAG: signal recognition particle-docking protein FtsY [Spirochaetaceae bacterium]|nr:signal recognition particle-docking protein FtsY [Spirochaetaceae bacterium]